MIDYEKLGLNNQAANILNWIFYDPNVGVESLHITGIPRFGKSNTASGLAYTCMKLGEKLVIPGDRFCEWRHFISHPGFRKRKMKATILVPEKVKIHYHPEHAGIDKLVEPVDYSKLNIIDHLEDNMVVIYDQHLWPMGKRTWLWATILDQLLSRTVYLDKAVMLLFHEAGIYFNEAARASTKKDENHYEAVTTFADLFVEAGKGLVRCIFISQLETEVKHLIRDKTGWKIFKKGHPSQKQHPTIRKYAPFLSRNEFISSNYGLYCGENTSNKFIENKEKWLMIPPPRLINYNDSPSTPPQRKRQMVCEKCGHTWEPRKKEPKSCPRCKDYEIMEVEA